MLKNRKHKQKQYVVVYLGAKCGLFKGFLFRVFPHSVQSLFDGGTIVPMPTDLYGNITFVALLERKTLFPCVVSDVNPHGGNTVFYTVVDKALQDLAQFTVPPPTLGLLWFLVRVFSYGLYRYQRHKRLASRQGGNIPRLGCPSVHKTRQRFDSIVRVSRPSKVGRRELQLSGRFPREVAFLYLAQEFR